MQLKSNTFSLQQNTAMKKAIKFRQSLVLFPVNFQPSTVNS
jgi:hypothetical protein